MVSRDRTTARVLRSAIAAVDAAEAVPADGQVPTIGGSGDAPRRQLSHEEVATALRAEAVERDQAITIYRGLGEPGAATVLEAEVQVMEDQAQRLMELAGDRGEVKTPCDGSSSLAASGATA
jgi:hypothetical protein